MSLERRAGAPTLQALSPHAPEPPNFRSFIQHPSFSSMDAILDLNHKSKTNSRIVGKSRNPQILKAALGKFKA